MNSRNYFYREPLNSSVDKDYYYIYHYDDPSKYNPDEVVFLILVCLFLNIITAVPVHTFLLISIIQDKKLHTNKFAFVAMSSAADLLNAMTNSIISSSAIRTGLILKTACLVGGTFHASSSVVRTWALPSVGILAIIKSQTAHRPDTKRIQNVYTKAEICFILSMALFYTIAGCSGLVSEFFSWDEHVFTCANKPSKVAELLRDNSHDGFGAWRKTVYFIIVPLASLIISLPLLLTIYLTYRKCKFYGCRNFRIQPATSSTSDKRTSTKLTSTHSAPQDKSATQSVQLFKQEEKEELDTYIALCLKCALWLPRLLIYFSKSVPVQSLVYHVVLVLGILIPCVFIRINPTLRERFFSFIHYLRLYKRPSVQKKDGKPNLTMMQITTNRLPALINTLSRGSKISKAREKTRELADLDGCGSEGRMLDGGSRRSVVKTSRNVDSNGVSAVNFSGDSPSVALNQSEWPHKETPLQMMKSISRQTLRITTKKERMAARAKRLASGSVGITNLSRHKKPSSKSGSLKKRFSSESNHPRDSTEYRDSL